MSTIHLHATTTLTPEEFVAGLTDFGPSRSELFENSQADHLEVHDQGPEYADVTEGTGGVWERLRYDWSDPNRVRVTVTDSNTWGGDSGYTYILKAQPDGTTAVEEILVRDGKTLKGRFIGALVGTVAKGRFQKGLDNTVKAIEARGEGAKAAQAA